MGALLRYSCDIGWQVYFLFHAVMQSDHEVLYWQHVYCILNSCVHSVCAVLCSVKLVMCVLYCEVLNW